ncbi:MAG: hypothetical protein EXS42_03100 [Lacunisphaera sp.]|nr:hypothetical protein [Lacunisphaera sp.]
MAAARVTESLGKFDPVLTGSYNYSDNSNPALIDTTTDLRGATSVTQTDTYDLNVGGVLPWGMTYRLGGNSTNARGTFNAYTDNFATFAGVSGSQPLLRNFGFGPTLASIRIAQANRSISEWQFRQAVIDTVTRVIFTYNDLNFALANLRSAIRSRELAAQLLAENEKRFKVGAMSEYDVTSARSRVASREEGILFAERHALHYRLRIGRVPGGSIPGFFRGGGFFISGAASLGLAASATKSNCKSIETQMGVLSAFSGLNSRLTAAARAGQMNSG